MHHLNQILHQQVVVEVEDALGKVEETNPHQINFQWAAAEAEEALVEVVGALVEVAKNLHEDFNPQQIMRQAYLKSLLKYSKRFWTKVSDPHRSKVYLIQSLTRSV